MPGWSSAAPPREAGSYAAGEWLTAGGQVLEDIRRTQLPAIAHAAELCAAAIGAGALVHTFGTGHSRIALEELFPRYGSYPGFHPIAELSMTFHTQVTGANGQRQAMFIEGVEGLAEQILANFVLDPADVMMVFSASGVSAVPIEMALGARARGLPVVAVTSVEQSKASPSRYSAGTRLLDSADIVIDLCTPAGDAMVALDGVEPPIGPGSTLAYAAVANEIKVQTAARLVERAALPPVLVSSALVGPERAEAAFEAVYAEHARRLAGALVGRDRD